MYTTRQPPPQEPALSATALPSALPASPPRPQWAPPFAEIRDKRENGRYYTAGNPFDHPAFLAWAERARLRSATVLEPFAGANSLIERLREMGLCSAFASFDAAPASPDVQRRDTLADFPEGYDVCVTNPPWLARNSAAWRGLAFPDTRHDDLYKVALERCLDNCPFVAALVPDSFIRAGLFHDRLFAFVSLTADMFADTGHPVGLALFDDAVGQPDRMRGEVVLPTAPLFDDAVGQPDRMQVWSGDLYVGDLAEMEARCPKPLPGGAGIAFNEPRGNAGLLALDNTIEASIRFCDVRELAGYHVKPSGRAITVIAVDGPVRIAEWNAALTAFRGETRDALMTAYKGIRKDGMYRRRCDWALARGIIHQVG